MSVNLEVYRIPSQKDEFSVVYVYAFRDKNSQWIDRPQFLQKKERDNKVLQVPSTNTSPQWNQ